MKTSFSLNPFHKSVEHKSAPTDKSCEFMGLRQSSDFVEHIDVIYHILVLILLLMYELLRVKLMYST